ncbi:MAG: RNA polymerase sigma factor [Vicinamibacterales bacterium]
MDEAALVARCRAGDGSAFEAIYARHAGRLYSLAYRMVGAADAEDVVQDIFLLAHRKLGGFRGEASLGTWLYRLATNHCLDVLRSRHARMTERTSSLDGPDAVEPAAPNGLDPIAPFDLERAIQTLPPACRAAFVLHDVEGFGHQEIGAALGISEGTSKSQVHKARMRIRAYLRQAAPAVVEP